MAQWFIFMYSLHSEIVFFALITHTPVAVFWRHFQYIQSLNVQCTGAASDPVKPQATAEPPPSPLTSSIPALLSNGLHRI